MEDAARVDVECTGFWNAHQDAFLDVRVFNPLASCNRNKQMKEVYQQHERSEEYITNVFERLRGVPSHP